MAEVHLPIISDPLIRVLNEKFPEMSPDPKDTEREIWMKAGERRLVRFMVDQHARQNEIILEN